MERPIQASRILGLFPYFDDASVGGVQASGRTAWDAVRRSGSSDDSRLLLFGPRGSAAGSPGSAAGGSPALERDGRVVARTKLGTAWQAVKVGAWPDLVFVWHLHLLRLRPLIRPLRARTVLFLHGVESWRVFDWLGRRSLAQVDEFLCNSQFTWRRFTELNPLFRDRPHNVVPLGLGEPAPEEPSPDPEPTVVMVSRLARGENYKGHRELISAWPLIVRVEPRARLWIVGDGDLRPQLESLARTVQGGNGIRFWGRVSERRKQELIGRARCLALPSRGEGFGLVYLEAMRLGRPCLVSDKDAGREVVNPPEAGLMANPDDAGGLAEAVCRLIAEGPEWNRWSIQSRRRFAARYTASQFQQRLAEALPLGGRP